MPKAAQMDAVVDELAVYEDDIDVGGPAHVRNGGAEYGERVSPQI